MYQLLNRPLQKLCPLEVNNNEAESREKETNVRDVECEILERVKLERSCAKG